MNAVEQRRFGDAEYGTICDERPKVAGSGLIRSRIVVAEVVPMLRAVRWISLLVILA